MEVKNLILEEGCSCRGNSLDHFLQPTILMLLCREKMHGFLMLQKIGETPLYRGNYPDPAGVYRYLKKMEIKGLLTSWKEEQEEYPSRRIYQITDRGKTCLRQWSDTIHSYAIGIEELAALIDGVCPAAE